jgi:hypothetical protein
MTGRRLMLRLAKPNELIDDAFWKLELTQDVTQFAIARGGGLLFIGYHAPSGSAC